MSILTKVKITYIMKKIVFKFISLSQSHQLKKQSKNLVSVYVVFFYLNVFVILLRLNNVDQNAVKEVMLKHDIVIQNKIKNQLVFLILN